MFERILVPLDKSEKAEIALRYALEIAGKFDGEIHIISVVDRYNDITDPSYLTYFEKVISDLKNRSQYSGSGKELKIFAKTLKGKPANEILSYADQIKANLIVMASRGASNEGPWPLGNIAAKILRATKRAVLLVKPQATAPAGQQLRLIKKILIPLDGSELGEAAIPTAKALAAGLNSELVLFHVDEPVITWGVYEGYPVHSAPPPTPVNREASARNYLDSVARQWSDSGLSTSQVVVFGLPARQIVDYAAANGIDLIAISTHGRSGIAEWVFGSVTDKILHAGDTPVLVIRPTKV